MPTGAGARTDGAQALTYLKRFGSVTVLNGHIHQVMQKVEGHVAFHTALSTAFPQPAPGTAPSPGPKTVPPGELRGLLGTARVSLVRGTRAARDRRYAAGRLKGGAMTEMLATGRHRPADRPAPRAARGRRTCFCVATRNARPSGRQAAKVNIDNFAFTPATTHRAEREHRDLGEPRRHPASGRVPQRERAIEGAGHRPVIRLHVREARTRRLFLRAASAHDRNGRGHGVASAGDVRPACARASLSGAWRRAGFRRGFLRGGFPVVARAAGRERPAGRSSVRLAEALLQRRHQVDDVAAVRLLIAFRRRCPRPSAWPRSPRAAGPRSGPPCRPDRSGRSGGRRAAWRA